MFSGLISFLDKYLKPFAVKMSQNKFIRSITNGMLGIIPIMIGVSFVSIMVNLPIPSWIAFLNHIKIIDPATELIAATSSLLAIYTVISVAYSYAKEVGQDPKPTSLIATAVFILLMPQSVQVGKTKVAALLSTNLGSNGIFLAIVVALIVGATYEFLIKKDIKFKMPEQVPANVVDSMMAPMLAAMIIITGGFAVKYAISLTNYNDIFSLFYKVFTAPAMLLGKSAWSAIIFYFALRAVFWFFGIHPSPLNAIYLPLQSSVIAANISAQLAGKPLPYLDFDVMAQLCMIGGTACTLGLGLDILLFGKAKRYKEINKIAFIPGLFNINEPYVFGIPLMLNPIMLLPMILAPISGGLVGLAFIKLGLINSSNFISAVTVAWVLPMPVQAFLRGGFMLLLACLTAIVVQAAVYYPFFKSLDRDALKEEKLQEEQEAAVSEP